MLATGITNLRHVTRVSKTKLNTTVFIPVFHHSINRETPILLQKSISNTLNISYPTIIFSMVLCQVIPQKPHAVIGRFLLLLQVWVLHPSWGSNLQCNVRELLPLCSLCHCYVPHATWPWNQPSMD